VLCELLGAEGAELLWSDCGVELLDGLLEDGLAVCPLLLVLVLGAAVLELEDDDDGVWLLEEGSWSDCG
jgi:hypothetical protein